ncbi:unnamed protein product, partial [Effrenium voratum]
MRDKRTMSIGAAQTRSSEKPVLSPQLKGPDQPISQTFRGETSLSHKVSLRNPPGFLPLLDGSSAVLAMCQPGLSSDARGFQVLAANESISQSADFSIIQKILTANLCIKPVAGRMPAQYRTDDTPAPYRTDATKDYPEAVQISDQPAFMEFSVDSEARFTYPSPSGVTVLGSRVAVVQPKGDTASSKRLLTILGSRAPGFGLMQHGSEAASVRFSKLAGSGVFDERSGCNDSRISTPIVLKKSDHLPTALSLGSVSARSLLVLLWVLRVAFPAGPRFRWSSCSPGCGMPMLGSACVPMQRGTVDSEFVISGSIALRNRIGHEKCRPQSRRSGAPLALSLGGVREVSLVESAVVLLVSLHGYIPAACPRFCRSSRSLDRGVTVLGFRVPVMMKQNRSTSACIHALPLPFFHSIQASSPSLGFGMTMLGSRVRSIMQCNNRSTAASVRFSKLAGFVLLPAAAAMIPLSLIAGRRCRTSRSFGSCTLPWALPSSVCVFEGAVALSVALHGYIPTACPNFRRSSRSLDCGVTVLGSRVPCMMKHSTAASVQALPLLFFYSVHASSPSLGFGMTMSGSRVRSIMQCNNRSTVSSVQFPRPVAFSQRVRAPEISWTPSGFCILAATCLLQSQNSQLERAVDLLLVHSTHGLFATYSADPAFRRSCPMPGSVISLRSLAAVARESPGKPSQSRLLGCWTPLAVSLGCVSVRESQFALLNALHENTPAAGSSLPWSSPSPGMIVSGSCVPGRMQHNSSTVTSVQFPRPWAFSQRVRAPEIPCIPIRSVACLSQSQSSPLERALPLLLVHSVLASSPSLGFGTMLGPRVRSIRRAASVRFSKLAVFLPSAQVTFAGFSSVACLSWAPAARIPGTVTPSLAACESPGKPSQCHSRFLSSWTFLGLVRVAGWSSSPSLVRGMTAVGSRLPSILKHDNRSARPLYSFRGLLHFCRESRVVRIPFAFCVGAGSCLSQLQGYQFKRALPSLLGIVHSIHGVPATPGFRASSRLGFGTVLGSRVPGMQCNNCRAAAFAQLPRLTGFLLVPRAAAAMIPSLIAGRRCRTSRSVGSCTLPWALPSRACVFESTVVLSVSLHGYIPAACPRFRRSSRSLDRGVTVFGSRVPGMMKQDCSTAASIQALPLLFFHSSHASSPSLGFGMTMLGSRVRSIMQCNNRSTAASVRFSKLAGFVLLPAAAAMIPPSLIAGRQCRTSRSFGSWTLPWALPSRVCVFESTVFLSVSLHGYIPAACPRFRRSSRSLSSVPGMMKQNRSTAASIQFPRIAAFSRRIRAPVIDWTCLLWSQNSQLERALPLLHSIYCIASLVGSDRAAPACKLRRQWPQPRPLLVLGARAASLRNQAEATIHELLEGIQALELARATARVSPVTQICSPLAVLVSRRCFHLWDPASRSRLLQFDLAEMQVMQIDPAMRVTKSELAANRRCLTVETAWKEPRDTSGLVLFEGGTRSPPLELERIAGDLARLWPAAAASVPSVEKTLQHGGFVALIQETLSFAESGESVTLAGHSLGANVAQKVAECLDGAGVDVRGIVALDLRTTGRRAAQIPDFHPSLVPALAPRIRLETLQVALESPLVPFPPMPQRQFRLRSEVAQEATVPEMDKLLTDTDHFMLRQSHVWDIAASVYQK